MFAGDSVADVLAEVRSIDWVAWSIPLPDWRFFYEPETVVPAFDRLTSAGSEDEARDAYNDMLDAIGPNHSGMPYTRDGTRGAATRPSGSCAGAALCGRYGDGGADRLRALDAG